MQRMFGALVAFSLVAIALASAQANGREPAAAEAEESGRSPRSSGSQTRTTDLSGGWQLFLPAGFEHRIQLLPADEHGYRWQADGLNFSGRYELKNGRLVLVKPKEPRLAGFVWKVRSPHMLVLVEEPSGTGSNYCGAVLFRSADVAPRAGTP